MSTKPDRNPAGGMISPKGSHRRIWEYDGAFKCLDCQAQWGALPGNPEMPANCGGSCHEHKEVKA